MATALLAAAERKKVGMLIPPPVLAGALAKLGVLAQVVWLGGLSFSLMRSVIGGLLLAAALGLVIACGRLFKRAGTPVRPTSPVTAIVQRGPYRFSRNPMYLGMALGLAGLGIVLGSYCIAAAALVFLAVVHHTVVLPEERYLERLHGEVFRRYKQQVRRWI